MGRIKNQRSIPILLIVIAAVLVTARIASRWWTPPDDETAASAVRWVPLADAEAVARRTGKPILYDFTADWCAPCHVLDEKVFQHPDLATKINQRFIPVRVVDRQREDGRNAPEVQALQDRFGVSGFPTIVIADVAGNVKEKMAGFRGADAFDRMMERAR